MTVERGFTICQKDKKLFRGCESVGDSSQHVSMKICCPYGGVPVGTYHTHPRGRVEPSHQDIAEMKRLRLEYLCIEVPERKETRCYRLNNQKQQKTKMMSWYIASDAMISIPQVQPLMAGGYFAMTAIPTLQNPITAVIKLLIAFAGGSQFFSSGEVPKAILASRVLTNNSLQCLIKDR